MECDEINHLSILLYIYIYIYILSIFSVLATVIAINSYNRLLTSFI